MRLSGGSLRRVVKRMGDIKPYSRCRRSPRLTGAFAPRYREDIGMTYKGSAPSQECGQPQDLLEPRNSRPGPIPSR